MLFEGEGEVIQTVENTGLAVIIDIGEAGNVHPKNKTDVGKRLAAWALAKDYGKDVLYSGPLFKSHTLQGDAVIIEFEFNQGLKSSDGQPLKKFEITSDNKNWAWADAKVEGNTVVISSKDHAAPKNARYAWANNPEGANLTNDSGFPASPFTTIPHQ